MPNSDDPKDGQLARIIKAATPAWKATPTMIKALIGIFILTGVLAWLNPWKKELPTSHKTVTTSTAGNSSPAYAAGRDLIVNAPPSTQSDATKTATMARTGWTNTWNRSAIVSGLTGTAIAQVNADGTGFAYGTVITPMNVVLASGGRLNGRYMAAAFIHALDSDAPQINISDPNYGNASLVDNSPGATVAQTAVVTNSFGSVSQSVGQNNSGEVGMIANSPAASVNFGPKPHIFNVSMIETNTLTNAMFKTVFAVFTEFEDGSTSLGASTPKSLLVISNHGSFHSGLLGAPDGAHVGRYYEWEFLTGTPAQFSDFHFYLH